jgi:predicted nucleic acid-binding protein
VGPTPLFLIDKSALFRLHQPQVMAVLGPLIKFGRAATCAIVDLEVLYRARSPADYQDLQMFRHANYVKLQITDRICARAIEVQSELAEFSQHRAAGPADLLIAACAELHGVSMLHYDRDFDTIAAITGQPAKWVVPPGTIP